MPATGRRSTSTPKCTRCRKSCGSAPRTSSATSRRGRSRSWPGIRRGPTRSTTSGVICDEFQELAGDRAFADDAAIVGGLARIDGRSVMIIGHQKGRDTKSKIRRNFGMPRPEGYRKALRLMKLAERFGLPILTFIDTPGAYPGVGAEERGQSEAIARNLLEMAELQGADHLHGDRRRRLRRRAGDRRRRPHADARVQHLLGDHAGRLRIDPVEDAPTRPRTPPKQMGITAKRLLELGLIDKLDPRADRRRAPQSDADGQAPEGRAAQRARRARAAADRRAAAAPLRAPARLRRLRGRLSPAGPAIACWRCPTSLIARTAGHSWSVSAAAWIRPCCCICSRRIPHRVAGLRAIHVHHGLHPDAGRWAAHCQAACDCARRSADDGSRPGRRAMRAAVRKAAARDGAPCGVRRRNCATTKSSSSPIIATTRPKPSCCAPLRASGADGLAAMRPWRRFGRGWLWRPLLDRRARTCSPTHAQHGLHWIEDPGNADAAFDRNFLRHQVLPLLRERWPNVDAAFARSAALSAEAPVCWPTRTLRALERRPHCRIRTSWRSTLVDALPSARRARVLRRWIAALGLPPLPAGASRRSNRNCCSAAPDARACLRVVRRRRPPLARRPACRTASRAAAGGLADRNGTAAAACRCPMAAVLQLQGCDGFDEPVRVACAPGRRTHPAARPMRIRTRSSTSCRTSACRRGSACACRCCPPRRRHRSRRVTRSVRTPSMRGCGERGANLRLVVRRRPRLTGPGAGRTLPPWRANLPKNRHRSPISKPRSTSSSNSSTRWNTAR